MIRLLMASLLSELKQRWAARRAREIRVRYELSPAVCHVSCAATGRLQRTYVAIVRR